MFSMPRVDLAGRVRQDLAVLAGDDPGELRLALLEQLPDPEQDVRALRQGRGTPARERLGGSADRGSTSGTEANATSCVCSPVAGLYTGPVRPEAPGTCLPPIQCPIASTATA